MPAAQTVGFDVVLDAVEPLCRVGRPLVEGDDVVAVGLGRGGGRSSLDPRGIAGEVLDSNAGGVRSGQERANDSRVRGEGVADLEIDAVVGKDARVAVRVGDVVYESRLEFLVPKSKKKKKGWKEFGRRGGSRKAYEE